MIILFGYQDLPLETLKETYANTESQFMALEGMEVHYRDEGPKTDSIPIVLIHGTGASLHTFNDWTDLAIKISTGNPYGFTGLWAYGSFYGSQL